MIVTQFTVWDGQIQARERIDSDALDPNLTRLAGNTLETLRQGTLFVSNPMPDGPGFNVGLGLPVSYLPMEQLTPELIAFYEENSTAGDDYRRRTTFYLEHRGVMKFYHVVFPDADKEDAGLYGAVAGTRGAVQVRLPEHERDHRPIDEQIAEFQTVEAEIRAARPSFMCTYAGKDIRSVFGKCFAVEMLLNSEAIE